MYLNGIKHNAVTKLNHLLTLNVCGYKIEPLTLNIGSDGQTHGRPNNTIIPRHYHVAGYKKKN